MRRWLPLILLPALWATRLTALETLPLHNDEGLHLTRAVEVWNGHPFWAINDGKIVNHWLIAAFYPQNAPVFTARIATLFVTMLGFAAGFSLARRWFGAWAGVFAAALWLGSSYAFFYERMALSDIEAGALVVVALWAALRTTDSARRQDAALTGLALGASLLFKISAAPFVLAVALVILLLGRLPLRKRILFLVVTGAVVALLFTVPLAYLITREGGAFTRALDWLGAGSGGAARSVGNLDRLWAQLSTPGMVVSSALMVAGLVSLPFSRRKTGVVLLAGLAIPLYTVIAFGSLVLPRHYAVALPLALTLGGAGLGAALARKQLALVRWLVMGALAVEFGAFALQAYRDPGGLTLPPAMRTQYITEHSSGYGLREAVLDFPNTIPQDGIPIVGSMSSDGCRRANFYARDGRLMQCGDDAGLPFIEAALAEYGAVYVLADSAPQVGIDVTALDVQATHIAAYPRPGEDAAGASVVLWRVRRQD